MPLKLLYLIFVSQIYLNGLFSQQSNASSIFIISNENLEGNYYYLDEINIGHPVNVTKIKSLIIKTSEPILLFEATQKQTPYLLFPGDSLQLMPASNGLSFLKLIHPKDSIKRNQIDFFRHVVNNVGTVRVISLNIPPIYSSYNMAQRDSAININYQRRLNYLEEYSASNFFEQRV